jgi:hypothetical protein
MYYYIFGKTLTMHQLIVPWMHERSADSGIKSGTGSVLVIRPPLQITGSDRLRRDYFSLLIDIASNLARELEKRRSLVERIVVVVVVPSL